jgi:hypothetical protein
MIAFENLLPDTKSDRNRGYRFTPSTVQCAAKLVYQCKRSRDEYAVEEFPADLAGRAFRCVKPSGDHYDVLVADREQDDICDCYGFTAHGRCKHVDCLRDLISEGQLPSPLCNVEADVEAEFEDIYADLTASEMVAVARSRIARREAELAELNEHIARSRVLNSQM